MAQETSRKIVLVLIPANHYHLGRLQAAMPDGMIRLVDPERLTAEEIAEASIIIGKPPIDLLPYARNLEWLQLSMSGYDAYVQPGVLPKDVLLTNSKGAFGQAVGEHMLACTLEMMKKLHLYRDHQAKGEWVDEGVVSSLRNASVLVLGAGDIGCSYGSMCMALGAHVLGVRRTVPENAGESLMPIVTPDQVPHLLPATDVVACTLPSTPETRHMIDADFISHMKHGSYLLNVGRGDLIDQAALLCALRSGRIRGAALDVTDPEPLPEDSPLWQQENCVITPHVSGFFHLPRTLENIVKISAENLEAYAAGEPLQNVVAR